MLAITLGGLAVLVVGTVVLLRLRRDRVPPDVTTYEPAGGGAVGQVPGYMPGMPRRIERRDQVGTAVVAPRREQSSVDLDANVVRVQREA